MYTDHFLRLIICRPFSTAPSLGGYLLAILKAVSTIGRLFLATFAGMLGVFNDLVLCVIAFAVISFRLFAVSSAADILVIAIFEVFSE